jgi:hypothetical protein
LLDQAREAFAGALSPVTTSQWGWQTGCGGWMVSDLVTHVVGATAMYAALLDGSTEADAMSVPASVATSPASASSDFREAAMPCAACQQVRR